MNRECQNCKITFEITDDDMSFYERIKVPPPTFCPECRFRRRMSWRNDRSLHKRDCDLCKKSIISMYPKDVTFPVYCKDCWYSDKWDGTQYGRNFDFSRNFFEQFRDLIFSVPHLAIWQRNALNSPFSNMVAESKNIYLSISVVLGSENVFYSKNIDKSFNIFDSYNIKESDSCYENIEGEKNYNSQHLLLSRNCLDSYFLIDCVNCSNCALSFNLRNKEFYFRNKQLAKEEYFKEIKNLNLTSRRARESLLFEFNEQKNKAIYRYANIFKSVNSSGNNLLNVKNCTDCFDVYNVENARYCYRTLNQKDCMDVTYAGKAELMYEYVTGALNDYNVRFSSSAIDAVQDAEYVEFCLSSKNLFGCAGIRNKNNVILNKLYSKKEFEILREKIIKQMNEMPYLDKKRVVYKYGEFSPIEISPFSYNESVAQDFFPLTKEEIINQGYSWREPESKNYNITIQAENIPDDINEVGDEILGEVLGCLHEGKCNHQCMTAFRLTKDEFNFYKKHNMPIPNKCSNCRYYERFAKILPPKLWHRHCMKEGCPNEFETSYAPERPEIVYCERCYQQEVY